MIHIENKDGLIGDFLGSIPAMQALSEKDKLVVQIHPEAVKLVPLIYNPNGIVFTELPVSGIKHTIYSATAFPIATANNWYMSQAFFQQVGLPIPPVAPKADLRPKEVHAPTYDYIISPFARSLPKQQLLPSGEWKRLVDSMPNKKFCVIGTSKHDDPQFLEGSNVDVKFDHDFNYVSNLLRNATKGLISVVTGTSHLAFHLGVKNWILNNQDFVWGTNPDGVSIRDYIPTLFGEKIREYLENS